MRTNTWRADCRFMSFEDEAGRTLLLLLQESQRPLEGGKVASLARWNTQKRRFPVADGVRRVADRRVAPREPQVRPERFGRMLLAVECEHLHRLVLPARREKAH